MHGSSDQSRGFASVLIVKEMSGPEVSCDGVLEGFGWACTLNTGVVEPGFDILGDEVPGFGVFGMKLTGGDALGVLTVLAVGITVPAVEVLCSR